MNRVLLVIGLIVWVLGVSCTSNEERPLNVVFIMSDDLNNNLGCYGDPLAKTPNLDGLANESAVFENSHCQYPLCGPSRASIMTGIRPDRLGMVKNENRFRENMPNVVTLPQLFMNNGYYTGRSGKIFHYGVPHQIGTDGDDDPQSWTETRNPKGRDKDVEDKLVYYGGKKNLGIAFAVYNDTLDNDLLHTDGMVATEVIDMIEKNKKSPFFIAAGFFRPHCPYVAPKKYFDLYPLDSIKLAKVPENYFQTIPALASMANRGVKDTLEQKKIIQAYMASVSYMDACVGRILSSLEEQGLKDNTIIVFASDHGYNLGEHGLWQKMNLFETATKAPLMVRVPGQSAQKVSKIVEFIDIYPTLAAYCNLEIPVDIDGASMVDLLSGNVENWKDEAMTVVARRIGNGDNGSDGYEFAGKTIRTQDYRYTEWKQGVAGAELYDLNKDPEEMVNVIDSVEYSTVKQNLAKKLEQ